MKKIYLEMWGLARSYYQKGRPMDIDHIEWMMQDALFVCEKENLDDTILLPLVILHDVGYSKMPRDNPYKLDMRKNHMEVGAKIAKKILEKINYPKNKIEKISHLVSIHDSWAFGENDLYKKNKILGTFQDLDFMWMATPQGFSSSMKMNKKNHSEMLRYLENNDKPIKRPFSTKTTKKLYANYLKGRQDEIRE